MGFAGIKYDYDKLLSIFDSLVEFLKKLKEEEPYNIAKKELIKFLEGYLVIGYLRNYVNNVKVKMDELDKVSSGIKGTECPFGLTPQEFAYFIRLLEDSKNINRKDFKTVEEMLRYQINKYGPEYKFKTIKKAYYSVNKGTKDDPIREGREEKTLLAVYQKAETLGIKNLHLNSSINQQFSKNG